MSQMIGGSTMPPWLKSFGGYALVVAVVLVVGVIGHRTFHGESPVVPREMPAAPAPVVEHPRVPETPPHAPRKPKPKKPKAQPKQPKVPEAPKPLPPKRWHRVCDDSGYCWTWYGSANDYPRS